MPHRSAPALLLGALVLLAGAAQAAQQPPADLAALQAQIAATQAALASEAATARTNEAAAQGAATAAASTATSAASAASTATSTATSASSAATAAQTAAAGATTTANTVKAAMPSPCAAAPLADTLAGALGTGTPCSPRTDTTRPSVTQAANVTTDSTGAWSVTWARSWVSTTPIVNPIPVNTGTLPVVCNTVARSAAAASGKCWQANSNTLPGTLVALGGLVVNGFTAGAPNVSVMVISREPTQ